MSTIRIVTTVRIPDVAEPWKAAARAKSGGTGCLLSRGHVLTAAHVVAWAETIHIERPGDSEHIPARVVKIDHDCELALLELDASEWETDDVPILPDLPVIGLTAMLPILGLDSIELTEITITNAEVRTYRHSDRELLTLQADVDLERGNSGAPVFWGGSLIGVAFQSRVVAERTVLDLVPSLLVRRFLDAPTTGVPELGAFWQRLENPTLRHSVGVTNGILVSHVAPGSSADGVILPDDVITAIDGIPLDVSGYVSLGAHRIAFSHLVARRHIGDVLSIDVVREHQHHRLDVALAPFMTDVPATPGRMPEYLVWGGLVFTPLTRDYMRAHWTREDSFRFQFLLLEERPAGRQFILLDRVIPHPVNAGYERIAGVVVEAIDGRPIGSMRELATALDATQGPITRIQLRNHGPRIDSTDFVYSFGNRIELPTAEARAATTLAMGSLGIRQDRNVAM